MTTTIQRTDYTKNGYGKKILLDLINSPMEKSRAYYNNMHNYSLYNTCLLMYQMAYNNIEFSPCCSFTRWKQLGYHVNKGQRAMTVLVPQVIKFTDDETGEERKFIKFKAINGVFAMSQTNCKKFDILNVNLTGYDFSKALEKLNLKIEQFSEIDGNCGGYATRKGTIAINSLLNNKEQVHTLFHEIAHHVLNHTNSNCTLPRDVKEFEADTVAYTTMKILGIDNEKLKAETKSYIKNWVGNDTRLKELLTDKQVKRILKATETILKAGEVTK